MFYLSISGFFLGAYLLGSVNSSVLVSTLLGRGDPRKSGSGNPGATNTLRTLGKGWAIVVLLLDSGRGALVLLGAVYFLPGQWAPFVAASGVLMGNLFPIFHGFRGGKGVATTLGIYFALSPSAAGLGVLVWLLVVSVTRYSSLGSLCMVVSYPILLELVGQRPWGASALACVIIPVVAFTHRQNIARLFKGEEHKLGGKK